MWKIFTIFAAFALVFGDDFEAKVKRLGEAGSEDLPEQLLHVARRNNVDHFCCKKKPIDIVQVSRAVARQKVLKTKVKVGQEPCGLWGSSRCTVYDYEYKQVTYYESEYTHAPKAGRCPQHNITCCHGYFYIKGLGRCVALGDLDDVIKAIEKAEEMAKDNE